jgi:hypothetical protein
MNKLLENIKYIDSKISSIDEKMKSLNRCIEHDLSEVNKYTNLYDMFECYEFIFDIEHQLILLDCSKRKLLSKREKLSYKFEELSLSHYDRMYESQRFIKTTRRKLQKKL